MGRSQDDQFSVGDRPDGDTPRDQVLDKASGYALDSLDQSVLDRPQNTETGKGQTNEYTGKV